MQAIRWIVFIVAVAVVVWFAQRSPSAPESEIAISEPQQNVEQISENLALDTKAQLQPQVEAMETPPPIVETSDAVLQGAGFVVSDDSVNGYSYSDIGNDVRGHFSSSKIQERAFIEEIKCDAGECTLDIQFFDNTGFAPLTSAFMTEMNAQFREDGAEPRVQMVLASMTPNPSGDVKSRLVIQPYVEPSVEVSINADGSFTIELPESD
ncbi:MAG: hypothetical protein AAF578_10280 [Pseudomonadota bacterium]